MASRSYNWRIISIAIGSALISGGNA